MKEGIWTCPFCNYMNKGPICTKCKLPEAVVEASRNPVLPQDRAADMWDNWLKYGYVMFPQQRAIYRQIAERVVGFSVLEAGCGLGQGTAMLERRARNILGTDAITSNISFAASLYPWIGWGVWDIQEPCPYPVADAVVCVECVEHVAEPAKAIANLVAAARLECWISTPNGTGKPRPPSNPHHVCEYTPEEMRAMIWAAGGVSRVELLGWEDFKPLDWDTAIDPLVYRIIK